MSFLRGLFAAFSMYSVLPSPQSSWEEGNLRYALAAFPLVGAVIGALFWLWMRLSVLWSLGAPLRAAGALIILLGVSGGIHLDGFCDTVDALASRQSVERKLLILKDSHIGAFAVIGCGLYLLLYFALLCEIDPTARTIDILALGFVLSRAASALAVVTFPAAGRGGTLAHFARLADRRAVLAVCFGFLLLCAAVMLFIDTRAGGLCLAAAAVVFAYYRAMSARQFGGITGDLAGWFVSVCELSLAFGAVAAQVVSGGIL